MSCGGEEEARKKKERKKDRRTLELEPECVDDTRKNEKKKKSGHTLSLPSKQNKMVSSTGDEFTSVSLAPSFRAFAEYSGTLARASSIAHWQLRDLVCCVANPNASAPSSTSSSSRRSDDAYDPQLFVVRHCSTLRYSLRDRKVRSIMTICDRSFQKARGTKENETPKEERSFHLPPTPSVDSKKTHSKKKKSLSE